MQKVFLKSTIPFYIILLLSGLTPTKAGTIEDFQSFQNIITIGANRWESFTIGTDTYLAVANARNGSVFSVDSKIYKWDGADFELEQTISTDGAHDWEFFTIGSDSYLVVANYYDDSSYTINSTIYKWNGTSFASFQSIATEGAKDWEHFTIGDDHYLVVANHYDGSTYNNNSEIYKWNGTNFSSFQSIATKGAIGWESFHIGSDTYLAVANYNDGTTTNLNSTIYKWNGTSFASFQNIATYGGWSWEFIAIGGEAYLMASNMHNGSTWAIDSNIYKWDGSTFSLFQAIPTVGASEADFFTYEGEYYLAVGHAYDGNGDHNINSYIYKWSGASFTQFQTIATSGLTSWEYFTIGTDSYLAFTNWNDDTSTTINSKIYKASQVATGPVNSLWTQGTGDNIYRLDGNVGIGTSSPQTKTHIADGDTPTLRLEQDNSESNTPQTWDLAGNETQFYISDITNTKTPFGIAPNSPEDSIFIGTGGVGIKTSTPDSAAHIIGKVLISDADDGAVTGQNYLHIVGEDSSLHIERDSTTTNDSLNIMNLVNNGRIFLRMEDTSNSKIWNTGTQNNDYFINDGGDSEIEFRLYQNGNLTITGSLTEMSDRASKENIRAVDPSQILSKVIDLPLNTWNYIDTEDEVVHLGPMAQDFYAAFGLNNSPKGISSLDTSGVALAAIQGLNQALEEKDAKFNQLLEEKDARIQDLENRLKALEELLNTSVDRK